MTQNNEKLDVKTQNQPEENPVIEIAKTLVTAFVLAIGIRTLVAEARYIPSSSMEPTLEINDRLIVEKIGYRFRTPERGDVVVFSPTEELRKRNFKDAFIKRVIGLPGDTVEVKIEEEIAKDGTKKKKGVVYVNGEVLEEKYIKEAPDYEYGPVKVPSKNDKVESSEEPPEDQYLVLGDNRNNSYDSHYWGFVPRKNLIGRAVVRFWPLDRLGTIDETPIYPED